MSAEFEQQQQQKHNKNELNTIINIKLCTNEQATTVTLVVVYFIASAWICVQIIIIIIFSLRFLQFHA